MGTVHTVLTIVTNETMHLTQFDQFDSSSPFLYGTLDEAVYVKQPEDYSNDTNRVY